MRAGPAAVKRARLSTVDAVLWIIRIAAIVGIVWGAFFSLTGGRLSIGDWRDLVVIGISQGSIYVLIALGYTMVYGVLRFINFAHGEVFMVGAMTGYFVSDALAGTFLWRDYAVLALLIVLLCCMATSTAVALVLERVCYRPLRGLPRLIPFITAIGASFFLQYAMAGLVGVDEKHYPRVEMLRGSLSFPGFSIRKTDLLVIIVATLVMLGLYLYVEKTRAGKAMRAVAEDQEIARLMGINVDRTIARVFAVGGTLAGAAGLLYGLSFQNVNFSTGFIPGIKAFTAAVLGGIGNIPGAMLGGLTLGTAESLGPSLVLTGHGIPSAHQLKDLVAFSVLVLVLIFRPSGLLGERVTEDRA